MINADKAIDWKNVKREDFCTEQTSDSEKDIEKKVKELVISSIKACIDDDSSKAKGKSTGKKIGIMFSGGIDSTTIAFICRSLDKDFTCYTACLDEPSMSIAEDLIYAEKAAKEYGFELKTIKIKLKDVEIAIKDIIGIIKSSNVVKVGVALPVYFACKAAKKDGVDIIFSGLGSEEIFAGYERHKNAYEADEQNVNEECVNGLLQIYQRDITRDEALAKEIGLRLCVPFLEKNLVEYALTIPSRLKINKEQNKLILRKVAEKLGIKKEFAERKKRAAQYGSKFDKAIMKLAKVKGFDKKGDYLDSLTDIKNTKKENKIRLGALWSSGKDSAYAVYKMKKQGYEISCLMTMKSKNKDSYMFHTPNISMAELQSKAMDIPLFEAETHGEKEEELDDLKDMIRKARDKYGFEGITTGALYSDYQRERIEKIADELGLKVFSPLWHMDQEEELRQVIKEGFEIIFSSVAAEGLDKSWLGKKITQKDVDKLVDLKKRYGINVAGEGGEFESLVINCPMFKKRIRIVDAEIKEESKNTAKYIIKKAELYNQ